MFAVIDTNVFVSALITKNPASPTRLVYDYIDSGDIIPLYNDEIIAEYKEVQKDRVFYEVSLSIEDSFLVTGNLKHFPATPQVVTPNQVIEIITRE